MRLALATACCAALLCGSAAQAFERSRTTYNAKHFWADATIRVVLDGSLDDEEKAAARRAVATWQAACGALRLVESEAAEASEGIIVIVKEALAASDRTLAARTDVDADLMRGRVRGARVRLDVTRRWSTRAVTPADALDVETIVLHELGHALGLGHSRVRAATMAAGARPGRMRRTLHDDDIQGVCALTVLSTSSRSTPDGLIHP